MEQRAPGSAEGVAQSTCNPSVATWQCGGDVRQVTGRMVVVFAGMAVLDAKMNAECRARSVDSDHNLQQEGRR